MEQNPSRTSEEQGGQGQTAHLPPAPLVPKEPYGADIHGTKEHQEPPKTEKQPPKPSRFKRLFHFFNKSEWVNVFLTAVIAVTGVIGIVLVIQGGKDTARIRDAAEKQACAAHDFAESADAINIGIADAVSKLQIQANQTAELARQSTTQNRDREAEARAFVNIKKSLVTHAQLGGSTVEEWWIGVSLENSGATPTVNAIQTWGWTPTIDAIPDNSPLPKPERNVQHNFVIGPKESFEERMFPISVQVLREVQEHKRHLYIWYFITYSDVFLGTPRHVSMFCVEVDSIWGNLTQNDGTLGLSYMTTVGHNCADDQCDQDSNDPRKLPSEAMYRKSPRRN